MTKLRDCSIASRPTAPTTAQNHRHSSDSGPGVCPTWRGQTCAQASLTLAGVYYAMEAQERYKCNSTQLYPQTQRAMLFRRRPVVALCQMTLGVAWPPLRQATSWPELK